MKYYCNLCQRVVYASKAYINDTTLQSDEYPNFRPNFKNNFAFIPSLLTHIHHSVTTPSGLTSLLLKLATLNN